MESPITSLWNWLRREDLVEDLTKKLNLAKEKIDDILFELEFINKVNSSEEYWNNNWKQSNITYKAREDTIKFDVRNFITYPDNILKSTITKYNLQGNTEEETVLKIINWVNKNITYVTDSKAFNFTEHWDFPAEVLYRGKCDCDGFSHLIISLCRNAEIPAYKLKVACGYVSQGSGIIGHSYPIYLRSDDEWVPIEGAYYPKNISIGSRIPVRKNPIYNPTDNPIWFSFNDVHSWSQRNIIIKPGEI